MTDADDDDDDNMCTLIVAVLQKDRRKKRKEGIELLTIGYMIYRVNILFFSLFLFYIIMERKPKIALSS